MQVEIVYIQSVGRHFFTFTFTKQMERERVIMNRKKERLVLVLAAMAAMPAVSLAAEPPVIPDSARTTMEEHCDATSALLRGLIG